MTACSSWTWSTWPSTGVPPYGPAATRRRRAKPRETPSAMARELPPNAWTGRSRRPDVTDPASGMLSCPPRGRRPIPPRLATPAALGDTAAGIDLVDRLAHGRVLGGGCRGLGAALGDEHARA